MWQQVGDLVALWLPRDAHGQHHAPGLSFCRGKSVRVRPRALGAVASFTCPSCCAGVLPWGLHVRSLTAEKGAVMSVPASLQLFFSLKFFSVCPCG